MRILLTNDDGISAPGLALLARVAARFGEVWIVAPDGERSAISRSLSLYRPLHLHEIAPRRFACDGTPADCIYLAMHHLAVAPDVVLSGVNPGPNLGHDVHYSGTAAGALEAAWHGVGALALSHESRDIELMAGLDGRLAELLTALLPMARTEKTAFNVNLPASDRGPWAGFAATATGERRYSTEVHQRSDPRGRDYFWIGGARVTMADLPGSDCNALRDGQVSVTPLGDDLTLHHRIGSLQKQLDSLASQESP
jgi:5'-nucleotidase